MSKKKKSGDFFMKNDSTKNLIKEFRVVHGMKYSYSSVDFVSKRRKVTIICRKKGHGEFLLTPDKHLLGFNCPKCGIAKSTIEREEKSNAERGERRNKPPTKNRTKKELSKEKKSGDFFTEEVVEEKFDRRGYRFGRRGMVSDHTRLKQSESHKRRYEENPELRELQSQIQKKRLQDPEVRKKFKERMNDPEVRKKISDANKGRKAPNKIPREVWIERFKKVHGDRYDYGWYDLDNEIIVCSIHGEFKKGKKAHWKGKGCPKCAHKESSEKLRGRVSPKRLSQEEVIKRFRTAHGRKYDYSRVKYKGGGEKVTIGCKKHGWFKQIPKSHMNGIGCQKCGFDTQAKIKTKYKDYIAEFRKVWGRRFDYSKFKYVDAKTKVTIICRRKGHGAFKQGIYLHLQGKLGCPKCKKEQRSILMTRVNKERVRV